MEIKDIKDSIESGVKGIEANFDVKFTAQSEALKKELNEKLEGLKSLSTKEEVETAVKAASKSFQDQFDELATKFNKQTVKNASPATLAIQLKEKAVELKSIATGGKGELEIKAVTNRAAITGNEQAFDLPDIGQLAHRKLSLYDVFPKMRISDSNNNGTIRYYDWDEATIARAAAMVAEGAAFPESTAKFKKGSIDLQKVGDTLAVTEEFFEDEAMFAAELGMFLETNVKLKEEDQIGNGDGLGNNLKGLMASIDAYTPVASSMTDASIYDLAVKVKEDISVTGGSKYSADVLLAPQSVINKMKLKKDANNNYITPPFVSRDGQLVDGLTVIEANILPADSLVVADRRFARIYEKTGYEVSSDRVASQFLTDEMTLKIRKRLAFLIREADKGGFRKVVGVDAALTTLATTPV